MKLDLCRQVELAIEKSNHFEEDLELLARLFKSFSFPGLAFENGEHFPEFRNPFIQGMDVSVVCDFLSHIPPGSLDGVELRRVWGQINQF